MPERTPLVSAIIPAHNAQRYLHEAIATALDQTYSPVEIIVVDDGSTDRTWEIVRAHGERVLPLRQPNGGPSAARNAGARAATGTVLAFLDADDRWRPDLLSRLLETLAAEDADAAACAYRVVDADGSPAGLLRMAPMPTLESMLTFHGSVASQGSNLVIKRGAFEAIGGFDDRLRLGEDWEFLSRIVTSLRLAYLDEPLADYRRHPEGRSRDVDALARNMLAAFGIVFERGGGELRPLRRRAYARLHRMLSGSFADAGRPLPAALHAARSAAWDPLSAGQVVAPALRRVRSRGAGARARPRPDEVHQAGGGEDEQGRASGNGKASVGLKDEVDRSQVDGE